MKKIICVLVGLLLTSGANGVQFQQGTLSFNNKTVMVENVVMGGQLGKVEGYVAVISGEVFTTKQLINTYFFGQGVKTNWVFNFGTLKISVYGVRIIKMGRLEYGPKTLKCYDVFFVASGWGIQL